MNLKLAKKSLPFRFFYGKVGGLWINRQFSTLWKKIRKIRAFIKTRCNCLLGFHEYRYHKLQNAKPYAVCRHCCRIEQEREDGRWIKQKDR